MTLDDQHSATTLKRSVHTKRKGATGVDPDAPSSKRRRPQALAASSVSTSRVDRPSSSHAGPTSTFESPKLTATDRETSLRSRSERMVAPDARSHKVSQVNVVDLTAVKHVGTLEMVEGDAILQTLLRARTPRRKRRFPSEDALSESERRDREALRRRRLQLHRQFSVLKEDKTKDRVRDASVWTAQLTEEGAKMLANPLERANMRKSSRNQVGKNDVSRVQGVDEDAETDDETTESKLERLSQVLHLNWRQWTLWLVSSALLLCLMVVAAPFVKKMWKRRVPYCDSKWIDAPDGSFVLADAPDHFFDRSKALQPFLSADALAFLDLECQPCPVYGNCLNGSVISCAYPYELQHGVCQEKPEIQTALDQLALSIRHFVIERAAHAACDTVSFWNYVQRPNGTTNEMAARTIHVPLSDVQTAVTPSVSYGSHLPRDYMFHRALDMALRDLKTIFVTEDQKQLVVGTDVVPWPCRARHQLYAHVTLIAVAVALGTALVGSYRHFLLYRTERQLVDRYVKEVRFFLLDRTRRSDRAYGAEQLRDELFATQSCADRAWLCTSVWPKVAARVKKDARIVTKKMRVSGKEVVVWEWASSPRRGRDQRPRFRAISKTQAQRGAAGSPVAGRRHKRSSRRSL
ncbi:hypothetical protein PsorP6_006348 [Peronosclerospora sorghi]|uniref:Uncharacterized protein n=1 Tax=Peronosclerospora sorghi TaxID=230839 RepID=A0ACC0W8H9_9STRA|nr:hypothetical protein PsorP6_006348 [Peronosclerospora sorghi]